MVDPVLIPVTIFFLVMGQVDSEKFEDVSVFSGDLVGIYLVSFSVVAESVVAEIIHAEFGFVNRRVVLIRSRHVFGLHVFLKAIFPLLRWARIRFLVFTSTA